MAAPIASTSLSAGSVVASARKAKPAGRQLGTLVVVVIKARNLPNKQRIGKQDPYCSITIGHQRQKTPAVKRGGQTPHWDAQLQFEIWEESEDKVPIAATETGGIGPSSSISSAKDEDLLPGQATVGRAKPKSSASDASKRLMKIACYADDPREPELIGETEIDYAATLKKGEFDEWVEIKHKGKYAGEVFIEMTFYSAAPPPVKRKSKPVIPGSGYGGPGQFEPLPDSYPQSPPSSSMNHPSTHLSPSPAQPLRMSQSQYGLSSSTVNRPPASSPSLDDFGRKRPAPVAFPTPSHSQTASSGSVDGSTASYNPPYAPPSLAASSSSSHLAKPHRASFSSYGMTQHDIDSMLRPLSSLSIGGSVNKPLPLPQPQHSAVQPYRPTPSPARPLSSQAFAIAPHPTPSPRPFTNAPVAAVHPTLQHHHSQPGNYQQTNEPYADHQHPPAHHHRHSMTTYLPDGSDPPWNGNQIPMSNAQSGPPHEIGLYHSPPPDSQSAYGHSASSWQDPRATSPYPQSSQTPYHDTRTNSAYGLASPAQSASYHPTALQPRTSPQFSQVSPPPTSHSPLPGSSDPPVWNSAAHYSSPVLGDQYRQDGQFDNFAPAQQYQQTAYQAPQGLGQEPYDARPHTGQYDYGTGIDNNGQYQSHPADQQHQAYVQDQGAQQQGPVYDHYSQPPQQQHYDNGYSQDAYAHPQQEPLYSQTYPDQHNYQAPPPVPQPSHLQQDYRTTSPYRPLPQPTPEPGQSPYHQPHYSPQPPYEPQAPPPRQPRFGLPVHQPYDPPYIPPSSRQQQHYQPENQSHAQQVPPPIPPVPQELRQDQYASYGYSSNRY